MDQYRTPAKLPVRYGSLEMIPGQIWKMSRNNINIIILGFRGDKKNKPTV